MSPPGVGIASSIGVSAACAFTSEVGTRAFDSPAAESPAVGVLALEAPALGAGKTAICIACSPFPQATKRQTTINPRSVPDAPRFMTGVLRASAAANRAAR
ncbi:MAG: hypothetical protein OEZ06_04940 [Myxococcales bacterium]|nr:hypothetical protein [Myxococcales bacterium]